MADRILRLASNRLFWELGDPFVYPYGVDIDFGEPAPAVWFSEGVTHGAVATKLSVVEALAPEWEHHFRNAEGDWLRPYLERMARGEIVTEEQLVRQFMRIHGRAPG